MQVDVEKPVASQHQEEVNAYFRANSRHWRDLYFEGNLNCELYRERRKAVLTIVDRLGLPAGSQVLEVGCGAGLTTVELAKRSYTVTAVDAVEDMLRLTRDAVAEAGLEKQVETDVEDVQRLSFSSNSFNLTVAMGVVPWVQSVERAISEMARVTRQGGYVIVTADNFWCLNQILDPRCFPPMRPLRRKVGKVLERLNLRAKSRTRNRWHTRKQMDELLARAGVKKLKGVTLGFGPFTFMGRNIFPDSTSISVHRKLQTLAYGGFPGLRSTGIEYVVVGKKS